MIWPVFVLAVCGVAPPPAGAAPAPAAPYAGDQARAIKALSAEETAAYLNGEGMGLARAAELNHYPGPRHVLDLREPLGLTDVQLAAVRKAFADMDAEARRLGSRIVDAERALDARFASGDLEAAELDRMVAAIAALQGSLRAAHLRAHLVTRTSLRPEQVARYDALRGYAGAAGAHAHH